MILDEATAHLDSTSEACGAGGVDRGTGRPDLDRHRAPALHGAGRRSDPGGGGRADRAARHPRGSAGAGWPVRGAVPHSIRSEGRRSEGSRRWSTAPAQLGSRRLPGWRPWPPVRSCDTCRSTEDGCVRPTPARGAPCRYSVGRIQPTPSAMRRALRRARDGVALDATEAGVLLQATGADLVDLCASAARVRDAGLAHAGRPGVVTYSRKVFIPLTRLCRDRCHYCTFVTVPGPVAGRLPLARTRSWRSPGRAPPSAARRRCSPSATVRRTAGRRPGNGWTATGTTARWPTCGRWPSGCWRRPGLLPHLNPGVMSWQEMQRLKPVAPSMGMMLETTSTAIYTEPVRRALRVARQGPGGPAAGAGGRRPQHDPVHHRHSRRHRRDDRRPRRVAVRDPRGSRGSTAPSRK